MTEMNRRRVPKPVSRERAYGAALLAFGILSLLAYLVSFFAIWIPLPAWLKGFAARWHRAAVELPLLALVVIFFLILIRMGWNMLTAPPARSLEEQEDALNQA